MGDPNLNQPGFVLDESNFGSILALGGGYLTLIDTPVEAINESPASITLSASTIDENVPVATVVGALAVVDPNAGDTHSLTLLGDETGVFALNGLDLIVNGALDNERSTSR